MTSAGILPRVDTLWPLRRAQSLIAALCSRSIVNDVSGGKADPDMVRVVADAGVRWVLMHWRSVGSDRPHEVPGYGDVVVEVRDELLAGVDAAVRAGVDPGKLIIDRSASASRHSSSVSVRFWC